MANESKTLAEPSIRDRFNRWSQVWKAESRYLSNTAQMAMLRSYQNIIGIGEPAVPLILEELRSEPDHWFWALESITLEDPVSPQDAGKIDRMAQAWVAWGVDRRYIS